MPTPFAAIESASVAHVLGALANATATLGGASVDGIFDNGAALGLNLVGGSSPTFACASADIVGDVRGDTLTIAGTAWTIRDVTPDGTGMSVLQLEAV